MARTANFYKLQDLLVKMQETSEKLKGYRNEYNIIASAMIMKDYKNWKEYCQEASLPEDHEVEDI
jgi:hypothetical protein